MHVAEVEARFAGTLLHVTRVAPGALYRIGSARGVDLALDLAPLTAFPLVDSTPRGFVVRGLDGAHEPLRRGVQIVRSFGHVTIAITLVDGPPVPLARRALDRRPLPFAALSLLAHIAIVVGAIVHADLEPITIPADITTPARTPTHVARFDRAQPQPQPQPQQQAAAGAPARVDPVPRGEPGGMLGTPSLDDLSAVTGTADLARELADVGPIYDEQAANQQGFGGGGGRFDPSKDPAFDSVKTGPYATIATGRGAGAHYKLPGEVARPPIMGLTCDDSSCVVDGTMDRFAVRDAIEQRYVELVRCYERNARAIPRVEVTLHFDIDRDGTAGDVRIAGLGAVGSCVARIVARTKFPAGDRPTRVTYPMAFWRT